MCAWGALHAGEPGIIIVELIFRKAAGAAAAAAWKPAKRDFTDDCGFIAVQVAGPILAYMWALTNNREIHYFHGLL